MSYSVHICHVSLFRTLKRKLQFTRRVLRSLKQVSGASVLFCLCGANVLCVGVTKQKVTCEYPTCGYLTHQPRVQGMQRTNSKCREVRFENVNSGCPAGIVWNKTMYAMHVGLPTDTSLGKP